MIYTMKIFTGNFANEKKYISAGLLPISIALSAKYFSGVLFRKLNPDWSFMNDSQSVYTKKFLSKLDKLNPSLIFREIEFLSKGQDVVLLCHEKEGEFCHRRLVASWFETKLKIQVLELGNMAKKDDGIQMMMF